MIDEGRIVHHTSSLSFIVVRPLAFSIGFLLGPFGAGFTLMSLKVPFAGVK